MKFWEEGFSGHPPLTHYETQLVNIELHYFASPGVGSELLSDSAEAGSSKKKLAKAGTKAGAKAGGFALKAVSGLVKNKAASKALGRVGKLLSIVLSSYKLLWPARTIQLMDRKKVGVLGG